MKAIIRGLALFVSGILLLAMMACGSAIEHEKGGKIHYLKYNFHYTGERGTPKGSVLNYTKLPNHKILPYGTAVKIAAGRGTFSIIDEKSGVKVEVLAKASYLGGLSLSEYLDLILSPVPVTYSGLSTIDREGVAEGKPYKGMSKQGVMIALGYPCPFETSSPDENEWYYWKNRFKKYAVTFKGGSVVSTGF